MNGDKGMDADEEGRGRLDPYRITVVSAGVSDPSTTSKLGDAVALKAAAYLRALGEQTQVSRVDLRVLSQDIAIASVSGHISPVLQAAIDKVSSSDGIVAASPIFKASYSGLFKSFWDVVDADAVLNMPVALTATGGSERHALMPDTDMRSLFAFLRAITVPTSVVAVSNDWSSDTLSSREERAGDELGALIALDARRTILQAAGSRYRHTFGSPQSAVASGSAQTAAAADGNAPDGEDASDGLNFDSALMRLAAGGTLGGTPEPADKRDTQRDSQRDHHRITLAQAPATLHLKADHEA